MSNLSLQETFQKRVSDSIRSTFLDMIPEEHFESMIKTAMNEFMRGSPPQYNHEQYKVHEDPKTLPGMIMAELREKAKAQIKEMIAGPEFQSLWINGRLQASKAIEEMLKSNADVFVAQLFGSVVQNAIINIRNNI